MRANMPWRFRGRPISRPVAPVAETGDDLATWPFSGSVATLALPGTPPIEEPGPDGSTILTPQDTPPYFLLFDVTSVLPQAARDAIYSLRFTGLNGVRLGHLRTVDNRIIVGGTFFAGIPITLTYYWGKSAVSQPGGGFPSTAQLLEPLRLALLFSGSGPTDYSANAATFTPVGSPTYVAGWLGTVLRCGAGNYVQTTAAKLRGDARTQRHAMALSYLPQAGAQGRALCWADWSNDQRAFQLWTHSGGAELYCDDDGASPFQRWTTSQPPADGWNFIGASWLSGADTAMVQINDLVETRDRDFLDGAAVGDLHNSSSPYIVGGTPVEGYYHAGDVAAAFEFHSPLTAAQMQAWEMAWRRNAMFLGQDRTPDTFSVPSISNQERDADIAFAAVQITGISPGTPISVSGPGDPTFAISSASSLTGDVRARGSSAGTITDSQWLRLWHTSSSNYSTAQVSTVTIGDTSVQFQSVTKAEPGTGGGGSNIPEGTATYTVTSLDALRSVIANQLQPGQIVQIAAGDYKAQGGLDIRGKDFSGGSPAVIRAATRPYRGYLAAEGGLMVPNESYFTSGSGGAEIRSLYLDGTHNLVFDGIRVYGGERAISSDTFHTQIMSGRDVQFQYCMFTGWRPTSDESTWGPTIPSQTNGWHKTGYGVQVGGGGKWTERLKFRKCIFQYSSRAMYHPGGVDTLLEDSIFYLIGTDGIRNDGSNSGMTLRRTHFHRIHHQKNEAGALAHPDFVQCWNGGSGATNSAYRHVVEYCILSSTGSPQPEGQGFFYEQDRPDLAAVPRENTFRRNLHFTATTNAMRCEKSQDGLIENVTVIGDFYAAYGGAYRDFRLAEYGSNYPKIIVGPTTSSRGGNVTRKNVYTLGIDTGSGPGDSASGNIEIAPGNYGANYQNYAQTGSSQVLLFNTNAVLQTSQLARLAPKTSSSVHPNQNDCGAWQLFDYYGVLP